MIIVISPTITAIADQIAEAIFALLGIAAITYTAFIAGLQTGEEERKRRAQLKEEPRHE